MGLAEKKCAPCEGGVPPLKENEIKEKLTQLEKWELQGSSIRKEYNFDTYKNGLDFVNSVGEIADKEGHHPDIFLGYKKVGITLKTHSIDGLSDNDFILAAKIDRLHS